MAKKLDLTGQRFGRLLVLSCSGRNRSGRVTWECRCDCGVVKPAVLTDNLRSGASTSCGCLTRERAVQANSRHGHGRKRSTGRASATYNSWRGMVRRCTNPADSSYEFYGGRGITVCDRWMQFENFLADMGERPPGMEIDRKENDKGYEPDNCRWATHVQNGRNTRTNRVIDTPHGPMLLCEAVEVSGLNYGTLVGRLRRSWAADRLFDPPRPIRRSLT